MSGKVSLYTCCFGHKSIVAIGGDGYAPVQIQCLQKADHGARDCTEIATALPRCNQSLEPTHEFYKPDRRQKLDYKEVLQMKARGFIIRKIIKEEKHDTDSKKADRTAEIKNAYPGKNGSNNRNSAGQVRSMGGRQGRAPN